MFLHILVPTDGSALSLQSAQKAVEYAKDAGAKVTVLHARQCYPDARLGESGQILPITPEQFEAFSLHESQTFLAAVQQLCTDAGVECETVSVASDDPAAVIVATAQTQNIDLIFMASHGRKGLKSFLMGSETRKVLAHAKIPVLVYR